MYSIHFIFEKDESAEVIKKCYNKLVRLWNEMPLPGFWRTKKIAEIIGENGQVDVPPMMPHPRG
jgi:hypothetical protein